MADRLAEIWIGPSMTTRLANQGCSIVSSELLPGDGQRRWGHTIEDACVVPLATMQLRNVERCERQVHSPYSTEIFTNVCYREAIRQFGRRREESNPQTTDQEDPHSNFGPTRVIDGGLNKVRRTINGVSLGRTQNTCAIARPVWVIAVAECLRPAG